MTLLLVTGSNGQDLLRLDTEGDVFINGEMAGSIGIYEAQVLAQACNMAKEAEPICVAISKIDA